MTALVPFVDPIGGVTFVEASAGTGKTYAIEMLYLRLLVDGGMSPEQIAVVTYTNAAAAELRQRIRARIRSAHRYLLGADDGSEPWVDYLASRRTDPAVRQRLLAALYGFDRAAISTIHGFCQRILVEHAFDSGMTFDLEMIGDQTELVDEVVRDFVAAELYTAPRPLVDRIWGSGAMARMAHFAARAASQPELVISPPPCVFDRDFAAWRLQLEAARSVWDRECEGITRLRAENPALHKNTWIDAAELAAGVAAAFDGSSPFAKDRWEKLEKLGATHLAEKTLKGRETPRHEFFDRCDALLEIEASIENGAQVEIYHKLAEYARREIPRRKAASGLVYFDDLLLNLRAALAEGRGESLIGKLRTRFGAALIDEFQDTDPVQYEIFRRAFADGERPLMLIGDPKQSIYAFRGADIHTYVAAREEAARVSSLDVNRRSSARLVCGVNSLFRGPGAFVLDGIDFAPVDSVGTVAELEGGGGGLTFLFVAKPVPKPREGDYQRIVVPGVAARIVALIDGAAAIGGAPVSACDVAVLCRTNKEANAIQEELRQRGVPTVLQGDRSVFETPEAAEMQRVLRALVEPRDAAALRAASCTSLCGASGDDLVAFGEDEGAWQIWADRFRDWRARWDEHGFMSAYRAVQDDCETARRLLSEEGGERRLTNFLHIGELLQVSSRRSRSGPQGLLDWLVLMSSDIAARGEMAAEDVQVRLESDDDAVTLTTIHKSKGLEYPIVFLPFLWKKTSLVGDDRKLPRFYDEEQGRSIFVGTPIADEVKARALQEQLAEEMRLAYVGLTRAKNACFAVLTETADPEGSPIGRLVGSQKKGALRDLLAAADGSITVEELETSADRLRRDESESALLPPPQAPPIPGGWRVSSFSGLTRNVELLTVEEEEGVDRDEVEEAAPLVAGVSDDSDIGLADLERGTRIGLMMHSVFEDLDFRLQDTVSVRELVERKSAAFRAGGRHIDAICRSITDVLAAPLPAARGTFTLGEVDKSHRLDELEFILPVHANGGSRLTPQQLAGVLVEHGAPVPDTAYAERVRGLGFSAFAGYLRGFIDMLFDHDGRWYVVDYKSNYLGARWSDYAPARLREPMAHHDYYLQYLLYVVAVDRYLSGRLRDYRYEDHFGGVFYLFLRGMTPLREGTGIFYDRPSGQLMADLSGLFGGGVGDA